MKSAKSNIAFAAAAIGLVLGGPDAVGEGPDLVASHLGWVVPGEDVLKWGTIDGVTGYTFATFACNVGDEALPWNGFGPDHPIVVQNLYRLRDDRLEQIGASWAKHGTAVVATGLMCGSCPNQGQVSFELLPNCADPYDAPTNGDQVRMGYRSDVNALTGEILFPHSSQGVDGDAIFKRMQVHEANIDPAINAGARYFIEAQYVSPTDAQSGNGFNNASYREVTVGPFSDGGWELLAAGGDPTIDRTPAIFAWAADNAAVQIATVDVPNGGRFHVASLCDELEGGLWRYEYAMHNLNAHASARRFEVAIPVGASVAEIRFHGVARHSGDPVDDADWEVEQTTNAVRWYTESFEQNELANALRWGSTFNFRFVSNAPPGDASASLELFRRSGKVLAVTVCGPSGPVALPGDADMDGDVDLSDVSVYFDCVTGPVDSPLDDGCGAFDFDADSDVDFADFARLQRFFTG